MPVPRRSSCRIFGEEVLRGCWGVDCSSTFLYYRSNNTTHLLHLVPFENTVFSESGGKAVFFERRGQPSNQTPSKQPYHAYRSCRLALGLATAVLDVHPQHNSRAARRRPQGTGSSFLIGCLLASCSRIPAHRTSDPGLPVSDKKSKKRASYKGLGFGARRPPKPTPRHAGIAVVLAAALVVWLSFHTAAKPADIQVSIPVDSSLPDAPDECPLSLRSRIAWGVGTSAYQVEGAADTDGRSASIWDTFSSTSGRIKGNDTGRTAADHYHVFQHDVQLMAALGIKHYRLSLSWSRILPGGGRASAPNAAALHFYTSLLQQLQAAGITPVVTLYYSDLPQVLQDAYGGFLDQQFAEDFVYYADVVFQHLGPYVRHWLTFSEPLSICNLGYGVGIHAPGVAKGAEGQYKCGHTLLLAHAKAVQLYRLKYQPQQEGRISMAISGHWGLPKNAHSAADVNATDVYMQFQVGWMADPLFFGDYPAVMRSSQPKLPKFKDAEKKLLAGSVDFFALNFYTSHFVAAAPPGAPKSQLYEEFLKDADGNPSGPAADAFWQFSTPAGLQSILAYVSRRYQRPEVWLTENGMAVPGEANMTREAALQDEQRLEFFRQHLDSACKAVLEDNVNLAAYFAWSFLDSFEWADGYNARYGIVYVDRASEGLERHPKLSAQWLSKHFFRASPDNIACLEIRSCRPAPAHTKQLPAQRKWLL